MEHKFDIAFSLLHRDLAFAQNIFEQMSQYKLKSFFYPHNQPDLVNKNGINVFSDVFKNNSRVVVLFYREEYGNTFWTRIEHSAIQERYLKEGGEFCILIPMENAIPVWYPKYMVYVNNEMNPNQIAELILKKIEDMGGELKNKTIDEYLKEINEYRNKKKQRYEYLKSKESSEYLPLEYNKLISYFKNHLTLIQENIEFLEKEYNTSNIENIRVKIGKVEINVYASPPFGLHENKSSQNITLTIVIKKDIKSGNKTISDHELFEEYKLNHIGENKFGWSKIIKLPNNIEPYYISLKEDNLNFKYDLNQIIYQSSELSDIIIKKYLKIISESHKS